MFKYLVILFAAACGAIMSLSYITEYSYREKTHNIYYGLAGLVSCIVVAVVSARKASKSKQS